MLEYDELSLLRSLGHSVFSLGSYCGYTDIPRLRPGLSATPDEMVLLREYEKAGGVWGPGTRYRDVRLTRAFVECFDAVVVMHDLDFLDANWDAISCRPVVLRTVGQSDEAYERKAAAFRSRGVRIVRYSPLECNIPGYCGADAVIRFHKDPAQFAAWDRKTDLILTFVRNFEPRFPVAYRFFVGSTAGFETRVIGTGGDVRFETQRDMLRDSAVYFCCAGSPSPYTLSFMEAWLSGIPVVVAAIEPHPCHEAPDLVRDGVDAIVVRDVAAARTALARLISEPSLAARLGDNGRQRATELFGSPRQPLQWKMFLEDVLAR